MFCHEEQKDKSTHKQRKGMTTAPDARFRRALSRSLVISLAALLALVFATGAFQLGYPSRPALANPRPRDSQPDKDTCLLYTSDAADDLLCVDLGGRRIIKKKKIKT